MRIKYPALAKPGGVITIIILKAIIFNIQKNNWQKTNYPQFHFKTQNGLYRQTSMTRNITFS